MSTEVQIFEMNGTNHTDKAHEDLGLLDHGGGVLAATTKDLFYEEVPVVFPTLYKLLTFPTPIARPNNGKTMTIKFAGSFTPIRYQDNTDLIKITMPHTGEIETTEEGRTAITHQQVARQVRFKQQQAKQLGQDVQEKVFLYIGLAVAAAVVMTVLLVLALTYRSTL
jgi:hypothetical protein